MHNKRKIIIGFLLFAGAIQCTNNHTEKLNIQPSTSFVLIDSIAIDKELSYIDLSEIYSYYPVFYMGPIRDTIRLGREPVSRIYDGARDDKFDTTKRKTIIGKVNASIFVNTAMHVTLEERYTHAGQNYEYVLDSIKRYSAFPVIITNQSDSLMLFGMFNTVIAMVREAKNKNGNWIQIEKRPTGFCGTGARDLFLEPGNIAIAKLRRYKGSFRTECRLRLGAVYSNVFVDYVDERQFNSPN